MTYLVLARKWRPRSFDTLIGQDHVVRALTHALSTQRLHHAWLFTGTRGVGKTTLSRILAKSLNCESGVTAAPCGTCRACTEIDEGRFVDYLELDAASNRGVDEMTQLLEQAVYAPSVGRYKVYMIDEVHMLTGHAFNAMLKTLEEPPPHVKFILATTDPQKIPVTVLSRCLQFNLKQMTAQSIVEHLQHVLEQEKIPYETPALRLIAQAASGSMRDALSLTDQAIAYSAENVGAEAVQGMLGTIDQRYLVRLLHALAAAESADVLAVADELAERGLSYSGALADLSTLLSRIAIAQRLPDAVPADDPLAGDIASLAGRLHPDLVQLFYSVAVHSRTELSLAPDEYAGFVMACLRMLALAPPGSGEASGAAPGRGELPRTESQPAPRPAPERQVQPEQSAEPEQRVQPQRQPPAGGRPAQEQVQGREREQEQERRRQPKPQAETGLHYEPKPGNRTQHARLVAEPGAGSPSGAAREPAGRGTAPRQPSPPRQPPSAPQQSTSRQPASQQPTPRQSASQQPASPQSAPRQSPSPQSAPRYDDVPAWEYPPDDEPPQQDQSGPPDFHFDDSAFMPSDADLAASSADDEMFETLSMEEDMGRTDAVVQKIDRMVPAAPGTRSRKKSPRLQSMKPADWPELAASLPLTGLAAELARQSEWLGVQDDRVSLRVAVRSLADSPGKARLRTLLSEHFGTPVLLDVECGSTGDGTAHAVARARQEALQQQAEQAVRADPFIQTLVDEFDASVVADSIRPLPEDKAA